MDFTICFRKNVKSYGVKLDVDLLCLKGLNYSKYPIRKKNQSLHCRMSTSLYKTKIQLKSEKLIFRISSLMPKTIFFLSISIPICCEQSKGKTPKINSGFETNPYWDRDVLVIIFIKNYYTHKPWSLKRNKIPFWNPIIFIRNAKWKLKGVVWLVSDSSMKKVMCIWSLPDFSHYIAIEKEGRGRVMSFERFQ